MKDQVLSQVLHRGLDLDTNGRRWSWGWSGPCHCQHSSHQSYHDESRPLPSWFVICNLFLSYSGCSSSGVSSGYPYTPAAQHKRGKVRSWSLVFKFLKHLKRNFLALIFSVDPNTVFFRMEAILSLVKDGLLRPHVSHSFPLEKANSTATQKMDNFAL